MSRRMGRVNELIREELSSLLLLELKDPARRRADHGDPRRNLARPGARASVRQRHGFPAGAGGRNERAPFGRGLPAPQPRRPGEDAPGARADLRAGQLHGAGRADA